MEKYIYLDRENAKKGIALVFAVKDHPVKDYPAYFGGEAIDSYQGVLSRCFTEVSPYLYDIKILCPITIYKLSKSLNNEEYAKLIHNSGSLPAKYLS